MMNFGSFSPTQANLGTTVPTGPTEPGRIPVSTGTVLSGQAPSTKPPGMGSSNWSRYQKFVTRDPSTLSKDQTAWMDKMQSKFPELLSGPATPLPPGPGGTPLPGGGVPNDPTAYMPDVGLLTRPYDNPFERRDLWQLFPNAGGQ